MKFSHMLNLLGFAAMMTHAEPDIKVHLGEQHAPKWKPYRGNYRKQEYDIRLYDGREFYSVWPSAGTFHTQDGGDIPGANVRMFRVSHNPTR